MENEILFNNKIKVRYYATNKENPKYLDFKELRNIDCKIYQDGHLIIFELPEERRIILEIMLNVEKIKDEEVNLTYINPMLREVKYCKRSNHEL